MKLATSGAGIYYLVEKADQANNSLYQSLALLLQRWLYSNRGDQTHALDLFEQALSLAKHTNDQKLVCQIYDGMGSAFESQGNYSEAIKHHNLAIEIYKRIGVELSQTPAPSKKRL